MQFSDITNKTGLVEDIDFICATDSTSFPLADKARLMNRYVYKAVTKIISVNKTWNYVDTNTGKLAWSFADLVAGQPDYSLPTNLLKLEGVSVLDSAGNWVVLKPRDKSRMPSDPVEYLETDGLPKEYDISGNSVLLYPAPAAADVTITQGLKVFLSKEIDAFTAADTTQEPGFPEAFHRICSWGPSYEWLLLNGDQNKAAVAKTEVEQLLMELGQFYSDRNVEEKTRIRPAHNQRNYI